MNAIVCDTDETARQCIVYLRYVDCVRLWIGCFDFREQRHAPETFLPLNVLEVQPIKGRFYLKDNSNNVCQSFSNTPPINIICLPACSNLLIICRVCRDTRYFKIWRPCLSRVWSSKWNTRVSAGAISGNIWGQYPKSGNRILWNGAPELNTTVPMSHS